MSDFAVSRSAAGADRVGPLNERHRRGPRDRPRRRLATGTAAPDRTGAHRRGRSALHAVLGLVVVLTCSLLVPPVPTGEASAAVASATGQAPPPGGLVESARLFGWTEGSFSVGEDGGARYKIPLWLPKGRGDVTPDLSLAYDSQAGNGLLGVGWSLVGLSSIVPCSRTFAQDGRADGVHFDGTDAYCLAGNRLLPLSMVPAALREYRTEKETFARIVAYGMGDGVADYFRVWNKDGTILTFGQPNGDVTTQLKAYKLRPGPDPQNPTLVRASDERVTAAWALNKVEDRNGNVTTFDYDSTEGSEANLWYAQMVPSAIHYAPNRSVRFFYSGRTDPIDSFQGGVHLRTGVLVSRVAIYGGPEGGASELLRDYTLSYDDDSVTGRSLLTTVEESDLDGIRKMPQSFQYSKGSYDYDVIDTGVTVADSSFVNYRLTVGDINGDGRDDLLYPDAENEWKIRFSFGSGFGPAVDAGIPNITADEQAKIRTVDFDRDGRMDVMAEVQIASPPTQPIDRKDWRLYRSDGSRFTPYIVDVDQDRADNVPEPVYFPDIDGNGMPDYMSATYDQDVGSEAGQGHWYYRLNTGMAGAARWQSTVVTPDRDPANVTALQVEDLDGDGKAWIVRGDYADLNGDALTDWIDPTFRVLPEGQPVPEFSLRAQLNSGNGLGPRSASPAGYRPPVWTGTVHDDIPNSVRYVDFNNDGADDLLVFHTTLPNDPVSKGAELWLWKGNRFVKAPFSAKTGHLTEANGFATAQPLDIDGNGVLDIVHVEGDTLPWRDGHLRILKRTGALPDQLITAGVQPGGPRVTVEYTSLANRAIHLPGECSFPQSCLTRGGSVVSRHRTANPEAGGWSSFDHRYQGGRIDVQGRGWLGFAEHRVIEAQTGATTITEFDNVTRAVGTGGVKAVYPFALLPKTVTVIVPAPNAPTYRRTVTNTRTVRRLPSGGYLAELTGVLEAEHERPAGQTSWPAAFRVRTTNTVYDGYGNRKEVDSGAAFGRRTTTRTTFSNTESTWLIGLRTTETTTGCLPAVVGAPECTERESTFTHDSKRNLTETVIEPDQPTLTRRIVIAYGDAGTVRSLTTTAAGGPAHIERFEYDADLLQRVSTSNAFGHTTRSTYHSGLGVVLESTNPNNATTTMRYDGFGRIRETYHADGNFERISHLNFLGALIITTTRADGGSMVTGLDPLGREIQSKIKGFDGQNSIINTTYDALGRVASVSRPSTSGNSSYLTRFGYDNRGRLTSQQEPDGATIRHTYDRLTKHTYDAKGIHSYTAETIDGDVGSRFEDDPASAGWLQTRFEYGPFGELTKTVAADGSTQTMAYDDLGRRTRHSDPSTGVTTSTYNGFGEQATETNGAGATTQFSYDALGRVTTIASPDGVATNTWDTEEHGVDQLATTKSADGVVTRYAYDPLGRPVETTRTIAGANYAIGNGYDTIGRPASTTYPKIPGVADRLTVTYHYNQHGYLNQAKDPASGTVYWQAEARNADGQLERERLGNGVVTTRTYRPATGLLDRILTTGPDTVGTLGNISYDYDLNRNVAARHDTVNKRMELYDYDELDRLDRWRTAVPGQGYVAIDATYAYDKLGNLRSETFQRQGQPQQTTSYGYAGDGAPPHALTSRDGTSYGYDDAGRQTSGAGRTAQYNRSGLPKVLTWGQEQTTTIAYDADGARVLKRDASQTVLYVPGLFERRNPTGTGSDIHNLHNVIVDGRTVAQVNRVQNAANGPITATRIGYLHTDLQDSTVEVTNSAGRPVGTEDSFPGDLFYDPFGRRINAQYEPLNPQRHGGPRQGYTSQEHEDEYGLINMKGRIYDPEARRFLTPDPLVSDPLSSQSHNRYTYVWNNPATRTDPSGFDPDGGQPLELEDDTGYGGGFISLFTGFRGLSGLFWDQGALGDASDDDQTVWVDVTHRDWYKQRGETIEIIGKPVIPSVSTTIISVSWIQAHRTAVSAVAAQEQTQELADKKAFDETLDQIKDLTDDQLTRVARGGLGGSGCSLKGSIAKQILKNRGLGDGQPNDLLIDKIGDSAVIGTKTQFKQWKNRAYIKSASKALTGNVLSTLTFAATGNAELAGAVGGLFDAAGSAAGSMNSPMRTIEQVRENTQGPLQSNPLKDY